MTIGDYYPYSTYLYNYWRLLSLGILHIFITIGDYYPYPTHLYNYFCEGVRTELE